MRLRIACPKLKLFFLLTVLLAAMSWNFAYGSECGGYVGVRKALPKSEVKLLNRAVKSIEKQDLQKLKSISSGHLLFIRKYISGESGARGGNLWQRLKWNQIDKNMTVHLDGQGIFDFSNPTIFQDVPTRKGLYIGSGVCAAANRCDLLPEGEGLVNLISGLMRCNVGSGSTVYVFSDGLLLTDMQMIMNLPIGQGLFFSKGPNGYRLSALLELQ